MPYNDVTPEPIPIKIRSSIHLKSQKSDRLPLQFFHNKKEATIRPPHPQTSSTGSLLQSSSSRPSTSTLFSVDDLIEHSK